MQYISGEARKPSIFVSSTCYDLKQIRQDIREFIEADLGYEAILSEYDSFPIDSDKDTINNCLRVVEQRADIMVLIVGSRYGYITDHGEKALKEALGERGTPGNAEYIIYVAEKLIEVYKSDHLWALDFKCISVPEMFEKLIEYTSELSKSIIEDIENFIDDYDKRINELSYGLEDISGEKVVSFNLELRSPDMNKIDAEIKRLGKILLNN